ncbi:MAG: hypothetical protein ABR548_15370 [Actinomycetota bacterium]|nr:hypothetical protein [Actinomycetota bacterium]
MIYASRRWVLAALLLPALIVPISAHATRVPLRFGPPTMISSETSEAWEPSLLTDAFGNIFITARRGTTDLALAVDERSPTLSRSASWLWMSNDDGKTFTDVPGYPLDVQNHEWGYEGDLALDDAGHLYFVDQTYADSTMTRWTVSGLGSIAMDFHRPFLPTAQPVDDRPFLAAHGDGHAFYAVNSGDAALNPFGREGGDAYGPGRFSVYHSTDGGTTFDTIGHSLRGSGACRPAADHRAGAPYAYLACTNDGGVEGPLDAPHGRGTLWAFASRDDGATYERFRIGDYNADAETYDWPLITVGPDGDVWVLHVDANRTQTLDDGTVEILSNTLNLFHSTDHGRTWSKHDITPESGRYRWGTLIMSTAGDLALAIQHRTAETSPWRAYAALFAPDEKPLVAPIDSTPVSAATNPQPPSELIGLGFAHNGALVASWTRVEGGLRRVYFSKQVVAAVKGLRKTQKGSSGPLPSTGVDSEPVTALLVLFIAGALTRRLVPRRS